MLGNQQTTREVYMNHILIITAALIFTSSAVDIINIYNQQETYFAEDKTKPRS